MSRFRHLPSFVLAALLGTSFFALTRYVNREPIPDEQDPEAGATVFGGAAVLTPDEEVRVAPRLDGYLPVQPQLAATGVETSTIRSYYDVAGSSAETILAQLRQLGPGDSSGRWAASTRWNVNWFFPYLPDPAGCSAGPVGVKLDITFTFPRWNPPPETSRELVERWNRYLAAIETHEQGHFDIAVAGAQELHQALAGLRPAASCAELAQRARQTIDEVLGRIAQRQAEYDGQTRHGATQGAVLQ